MIAALTAVLLGGAVVAAPLAPAPLGASTGTVSGLYTGDRSRDPFLPASASVSARPSAGRPVVVDIHALQLRGIMQDARTDYAIFSTEDGLTLMLRDGHLYDEAGQRVPGISGRLRVKQKRVELITADKDVQIYSFGDGAHDD